MKKIFWDNPYQHSLITKVMAVNDNKIIPEETIIYSFSGGQESDKAYINELPVLDSTMDGPLIFYSLPIDHGLSVGDKISMRIDWPRRSRLRRLHFGAELILEIVTKNFHLKKIGAHIAETKARIDFIAEENIASKFEEIVALYNHLIQKNLLIQTGYSDIENQRRYWKIDGFAEVPCGGTQVKTTAEVGMVSLKRSRPGKSIERIEIKLLDDSLSSFRSSTI